jgi:hypothetical protein
MTATQVSVTDDLDKELRSPLVLYKELRSPLVLYKELRSPLVKNRVDLPLQPMQ